MILERTPPELAADIIDTGIYLTGGSTRITNLAELVGMETGLKVNMSEAPEETVIEGISRIITEDSLSELMYIPREKVYK